MNLQYITDNHGIETGVYITIQDWNMLIQKYSGIKQELDISIPEWHKELVNRRLSNYLANPSKNVKDFETVCNEIENELDL